MRCLGKLIGLGLAFIFIVLFPLAMWMFNLPYIALREETYKDLFRDKGFYQDLIPVVLPSLIDGLIDEEQLAPGKVSLAATIEHLDYGDWTKIAPTVVRTGWVQDDVENNLENLFDWLDGDLDDLVIVFHTKDVREQLAGPEGEEAVRQIAKALPPCTPGQIDPFIAFARGEPGVVFPYCRPEGQLNPGQPPSCLVYDTEPVLPCDKWLEQALNDARQDVVRELKARGDIDVVREMESEARQRAEKEGRDDSEEAFSYKDRNQFRSAIRLWKHLLILVFLVPASLLSLIVIVAVRSAKSFFRWMGWPVLIGSLLTLVPLVLLPLVLHDLRVESETELEEGLAAGGGLFAEIIANGMLRLIIQEFTLPALIEAAVLIGIGFFFVVLSVLLNDPDAPQIETVTVYSAPVSGTPPGAVLPEMPTHLDDTPSADHTPFPDRTPPPDNQG